MACCDNQEQADQKADRQENHASASRVARSRRSSAWPMKHHAHNPLDWIDDELAELAELGCSLAFSTPVRSGVELDGRQQLNFGSNDYLGLAADSGCARPAARRRSPGLGSRRQSAGDRSGPGTRRWNAAGRVRADRRPCCFRPATRPTWARSRHLWGGRRHLLGPEQPRQHDRRLPYCRVPTCKCSRTADLSSWKTCCRRQRLFGGG